MDINEIKQEIVKLEQGETSWNNIQRLSWLYTVHDHMSDEHIPLVVHETKSTMPEYTGEFGEAVSGVSINELMNILTEHMSVIKVLHPKEYNAVIERILKIPR